jgi:16S rRNA (guanine966-N2)-methyltransferase
VRVIAGLAGGLRLQVPSRRVRPTMDRVKAAIFSSVAGKVPGAHVLDLFAGAGGLGIEALSRGAASAIFVESDRVATKAIAHNLSTAHLSGQIRCQDVFDYLRHASSQFDLIFADPPYERTSSNDSFTDLLLANETLPRLLAPDGIFVLEKRPGEPLVTSRNWDITRARRYGATEVLFAVKTR